MPQDGPPPECPECEVKTILNGGTAARVLDETCYIIEHQLEAGKKFNKDLILGVVEQANKVEDEAFKFQRLVLEAFGFAGPWSKALAAAAGVLVVESEGTR